MTIKNIAQVPRGIQVVKRINADGTPSTRFRVRINRKDMKKDEYFDSLEEAIEVLKLSRTKRGKEIIYSITNEEQKRRNYLKKEHKTLGDFIDLYIQDYVDTKPKDTELQIKAIGNIKSFYRTIRKTKVPLRNTTLGNIPELLYSDENLFSIDGLLINRITGLTINDYIKSRLATGVKKSSVSRELSYISNVFNKIKYYDDELANIHNPCRDYDYDLLKGKVNKIPYILSDEDETKLINAFKQHQDPQMLPIIMISLLTGMRRSEVINLTHSQIKSNSVVLPNTKTGSPRVVWLDKKAIDYIKSLPRFTKTDRLFWFGKWSITAFDKKYRRVLKEHDIEHINFHSLRRTNISRLLSKLGAENSIFATEFLGISNVKNFQDKHSKYIAQQPISQFQAVKNWHTNVQTTKGYFNFTFSSNITKKVVDTEKKDE